MFFNIGWWFRSL